MALSPFATQFVVGALIFAFGAVTSWLVWLTLRHYNYTMPAYNALFPSDHDDTAEGHLVEATTRFDSLEDAHAEMKTEVQSLHADVVDVKETQNHVISNQEKIGDAVGVDVNELSRWRGSNAHGDDD